MVLPWLHTDGIHVKDPQKRIVALRQLAQLSYRNITEQLIINAKNHGINCIVACWRWVGTPGYQTENFSFDSNSASDLAALGTLVQLCKQHDVYIQFCFLSSSSELCNNGICCGWNATADWIINKWTPIINLYKDEPTVVGMRILDEPNWAGSEEWQFWDKAIGALKQLNPNLLWFTHCSNALRFRNMSTPYLPSRLPPHANILLDAGVWLNPTSGDYILPPDDYARADEIVNDLMNWMKNFRDQVPIPTGLTSMYMEGYYPTNNAFGYCLRELYRNMEAERYMICHYTANWHLTGGADAGNNCLLQFQELFPDTPYSYYWDVGIQHNLTVTSTPLINLPFNVTKV